MNETIGTSGPDSPGPIHSSAGQALTDCPDPAHPGAAPHPATNTNSKTAIDLFIPPM
jgi:hypothetical protein